MSFYDNSPDLVDDIPPITRQEEPSEGKPAAQPEEGESKKAAPTPQQNDGLPDAVRELRSAPERVMFSGAKLYNNVTPIDTPEDATDEQRQFVDAANDELRQCFADMEMPTDDARSFVELIKSAATNPPSEEQQLDWRATTISALNREFGREAALALNDAYRLVNRDPRILHMIQMAGMADNPEMIKLFVRLAKAQKSKGRLPRGTGDAA